MRRSDDGGLTWSVSLNRAGGQIYGVDFVDRDTGWAVGDEINGPIISHTSDGGQSWQDQRGNVAGTDSRVVLRHVAFLNARQGVAVGGAASFFGPPIALVTADAGAHWDIAPIAGIGDAEASALESVCLTRTGIGLALGQGFVLRTENAGAAWMNISNRFGPPPAGGAVSCVEDTDLWVLGADSTLAYSPDGGETWIDRSGTVTGGFVLQDASFVDAFTGWVTAYDPTGRRGLVLRTLDRGHSWTQHVLATDIGGLSGTRLAVAFVNRTRGIVVGTDSPSFDPRDLPALLSFATKDGGASWTPGFIPLLPPPLTGTSSVFDVDFLP